MLKTVLTLCLSFLLSSGCFGQNGNSQGKIVFKAKTEFPIQLETTVYTEKNNVGDDVNFVLTEDVMGEGEKILKGTSVLGRIVKIDKISAKNDTAKVCIMFDFFKNGDDFMSLVAAILTIAPNTEAIKLAASPTFSGGTMLSLKGKEIQLDKGRIFRVKLTSDITK
jgi:hypothetical protein